MTASVGVCIKTPGDEGFNGLPCIRKTGNKHLLPCQSKIVVEAAAHSAGNYHRHFMESIQDTTMRMVLMVVPVLMMMALCMTGKSIFNISLLSNGASCDIEDQESAGTAKMPAD